MSANCNSFHAMKPVCFISVHKIGMLPESVSSHTPTPAVPESPWTLSAVKQVRNINAKLHFFCRVSLLLF